MNTIINIGRQFGSGGLQVGQRLAERLGFAFYDKELINIASQESGLGKEFFEQVDEKKRYGFLGGLFGLRDRSINANGFADNYLNSSTLFQIQSDVIRELAEQQSCIFVGRCADYILRENPRCTNIFITANTEDRIKLISQRLNITGMEAADLLEKTDKKRAAYYNFYTNKTWGEAKSYHLCINTSVLGIDETVEYVTAFVSRTNKA